ncbi:Zn(2+)-responsive transcriptional regulator [Vibrio sp.]|nr:Zn(2+)-responsive transcriptional regulator [Vibrio sp.]
MLKIGALAQHFDLSVETLRFYEKEGLLSASERGDNGYRYYSDDDIHQLQFVLNSKRCGFTHAEIRTLLDIRINKHNASCGDVKALIEKKRQRIQEKRQELQTLELALAQLAEDCDGSSLPANNCSILGALNDSTH